MRPNFQPTVLRGYMYRTKHRYGICRINLFSNVSLARSLGVTHRGNARMTLGLGFEPW